MRLFAALHADSVYYRQEMVVGTNPVWRNRPGQKLSCTLSRSSKMHFSPKEKNAYQLRCWSIFRISSPLNLAARQPLMMGTWRCSVQSQTPLRKTAIFPGRRQEMLVYSCRDVYTLVWIQTKLTREEMWFKTFAFLFLCWFFFTMLNTVFVNWMNAFSFSHKTDVWWLPA